MWCVAALRNLLSTSANHRPMLKEGVVDALVKLADSRNSFVALNATASLRTMTYNIATREALISKNAISVIIDDTNRPHTRGRQVHQRRGAQPAATDAQHLGTLQAPLTGDTDVVKDQVARVPADLLM